MATANLRRTPSYMFFNKNRFVVALLAVGCFKLFQVSTPHKRNAMYIAFRHRIDVNAINSEKATVAIYRILVMCDVHRI